MKKILIALFSVLLFAGSQKATAQEFFDTSDAEKFITFGGRVGFNTSDRSFPSTTQLNFIKTSWGIGFNAGVVANFNFKEYLSLQPGFFFESRSGNLVNIVEYYQALGNKETHYEYDHLRAYYFTIPVMGIVKFNLAENIKWNVEFGPYIQIELKETGQDNVEILNMKAQDNGLLLGYDKYNAQHRGFDVGFKMGTGLQFYQHYYIGVHYLAGACNAWKMPSGGKNKSWEFSIGYDF